MAPKILVVLTSYGFIEEAQRATGWYLPELAHPAEGFAAKNIELTYASPKGGAAPVDPYSVESTLSEPATVDFHSTNKQALKNTHKLTEFIGKSSDFDAIYYPGGAGPMWDLATDANSQALIADFHAAGKPVGLVCHAPVALQGVKTTEGKYLIDGKKVTGLTDKEEAFFDLEKYVPFSIEKRLKERGGIYSAAEEIHAEHTVVDGNLITGQNLASAYRVGEEIVKALGL